ncbi:2-oxoacid:acceptor oxidoreductase family protein [Sulfurospirillum sp. 1612]|uniref:2-oxoacid:acceptor oxidoreductase family protein n=1 Tax=Sulfurospirillum sp. 1612 TaxID=3094835 RepID=UPI002F95E39F
MRYQVVIAGIGGQGAVFLVKVLSIAAALLDEECIGTENHGMSQRGGSVSCYVKVGDFYSPAIDQGQADLLLALDGDEGLRNIQYLNKTKGTLLVNAGENFPELEYETVKIDAYQKAKAKEFDIQALNVYMLGITLAKDPNFPFSQAEIEKAITQMNATVADKNIKVLHQAMKDAQASR